MTINSKLSADTHSVSIEIGRDHFATHIMADGHAFIADEPEDLGGPDLGATPKNLLLSALGACIAITVRMYADRKGWPLEGIRLELSQTLVQASDCVDCGLPEDAKGRVNVLDYKVHLTGEELTPEMIERIMDITKRCPVHRIIMDQTVIRAELAST
jgi:uncharacterized OsmC-like protein